VEKFRIFTFVDLMLPLTMFILLVIEPWSKFREKIQKKFFRQKAKNPLRALPFTKA